MRKFEHRVAKTDNRKDAGLTGAHNPYRVSEGAYMGPGTVLPGGPSLGPSSDKNMICCEYTKRDALLFQNRPSFTEMDVNQSTDPTVHMRYPDHREISRHIVVLRGRNQRGGIFSD